MNIKSVFKSKIFFMHLNQLCYALLLLSRSCSVLHLETFATPTGDSVDNDMSTIIFPVYGEGLKNALYYILGLDFLIE